MKRSINIHTLTARPLVLDDNKLYAEMKCLLSPQYPVDLKNYLDKFVTVSGFLVFGANHQPLRLEIDEIILEEVIEEDPED